MGKLALKSLVMFVAAAAFALTAAEKKEPMFSSTIDYLDYVFFDKLAAGKEYYPLEIYEQRIREMAEGGVKKIYLRVNVCGTTHYPSEVSALYGEDGAFHWTYKDGALRLIETYKHYDPVAETIRLGKKYGMEVWAWESLFDDAGVRYNESDCPPEFIELYRRHDGWALLDPFYRDNMDALAERDPRLIMPEDKVEELKAIMKEHISTVVGRYKGKVKGWDVVNEAIMEDGSYRRSPFYEILGEEFIPLAFQYAHEADPDAELYYNDYNMWAEGKRNTVVKLISELRKRGLRIDAVGMQSHMGMDHPDLREYEKSIEAFAAAGVKVMVTEFDMSALPTAYAGADIAGGGMESNRKLNPYPDSLPAEVYDAWHARMEKVLEILLRHSDDITRVTFWGVCDGDSWLNGFPVRGRTDYALPFDRKHNAKPIVKRFIEMCGEIPANGGADNAGVEDNRK